MLLGVNMMTPWLGHEGQSTSQMVIGCLEMQLEGKMQEGMEGKGLNSPYAIKEVHPPCPSNL